MSGTCVAWLSSSAGVSAHAERCRACFSLTLPSRRNPPSLQLAKAATVKLMLYQQLLLLGRGNNGAMMVRRQPGGRAGMPVLQP